MRPLRLRSLVLLVLPALGCGSSAMNPAAAPPGPAPSRADQAFVAVGYSCSSFNDAEQRFSVHEIDAAGGGFKSAAFPSGSTPWSRMITFGPHRPTGRLLYTNRYPAGRPGEETLQAYTLDETGTPHLAGEQVLSGVRVGAAARVDPAGRFLVFARSRFTAERGLMDPELAVHRLDASGLPQPASSAPAGIANVTALVLAPSGRYVYAVSTDVGLAAFSIQPETGALQAVPGTPFASSGRGSFTLAIHPSGKFLYSSEFAFDGSGGSVWLHTIDAATGEPRYTAAFRSDLGGDVAIDPAGRFLYHSTWRGSIWGYAIDPNSGALTALPGTPLATGWGNAIQSAVDASGRYLYVTAEQAARTPAQTRVFVYAIDAGSGALTALPAASSNPTADTCPLAVVASR
jgi:6-phosphogluconolactonase (cycloisomerase 2 family)